MSAASVVAAAFAFLALWGLGFYLLGRRDGLADAIRTLRGDRELPR